MDTKRPYSRILLIDDEAGIRRMMTLDLTADGYRVFSAEDGASGLRLFAEEKPRLVLTDLKMPGMDGIEVLRRIKMDSPDTEVIVITGHGDLDLAIKSLQLNASDFITKPVNPQALELALNRAKERLGMKDQLRRYTNDLEAKVEEATRRRMAAERLAVVGETVSSLVHAIKNMLVGLKGGLYMVKKALEGNKSECGEQGLDMLERNLGRVQNLVSDLLTLAKPQQPELTTEEAGELCGEAVRIMAMEADNHKVSLTNREPSRPIRLQVDRRAILDSLANLISNAIHAAAEKNKGKVEVSAADKVDRVEFAVSDNGPGLTPEAEKRIFDGFFSTKGAAGTGLGLMVTLKHAKEHGGTMRFNNRPGKGVTFTMWLPKRYQAKIPVGAGAAGR